MSNKLKKLMTIIMLCGNTGAGKSTISEYLVKTYGFIEIAFADSVKDVASATYGWDRNMLQGSDQHSRIIREQYNKEWSDILGDFVTPRKTLQKTADMYKREYGDDIWAKIAVRKINYWLSRGCSVVVSDLRYMNELEYVKKHVLLQYQLLGLWEYIQIIIKCIQVKILTRLFQ